MFQLCYVYINEYRILKNVGISFDSQYKYEESEGGQRIDISDCATLPEKFWGNEIASLSVVVGNNGSGKSTLLEYILHSIISGSAKYDMNGVFIYRDGDQFEYYSTNSAVSVYKNGKIGVKCLSENRTFEMFNYSGHFRPYKDFVDILENELMGQYNGSDGWRLIKDFQDYANIDTLRLNESIGAHLEGYDIQNHYRIGQLMCVPGIRERFKGFNIPRYLVIVANESGLKAIQSKGIEGDDSWIRRPQLSGARDDLWEIEFLYHNMLNLIVERDNENCDFIKALQLWYRALASDIYATVAFEMVMSEVTVEECRIALQKILDVMEAVKQTCSYDKTLQTYYIDTKIGGDALEAFRDLLNIRYFHNARFFDILYSVRLGYDTMLSSGEEELLRLFSRIYDANVVHPKHIDNASTMTMLLLDEAEIGFHPAWQMQYIAALTDFLNSIPLHGERKYQVIVTTHSPIILSDVPHCCVTYLERKEDVVRNVSGQIGESFGANVFNLYRNSFFMKDGLVGKFAQSKILEIQKKIENGGDMDTILREIDLIGDEHIRMYLLNLLQQRKNQEGERDVLKSFYQAQLAKL